MLVTRTYLQLHRPEQFNNAFGEFPDVTIARIPKPLPALYRLCYRAVGEAFHWRDRWDWTDPEIAAHLADPNIQLFVASRSGAANDGLAGWYELRRVPEDDRSRPERPRHRRQLPARLASSAAIRSPPPLCS